MKAVHLQLEMSSLRKVLKRLHYPLEIMLMCVRGYAAYPLSLRHLEEMMAERGVTVDHATIHRWPLKLLPVLAKVFRQRQRPVGRSWRMDETDIKVNGQWKYLYRAVDSLGHTVDLLLTAKRDSTAGRRFFERAISLHDVLEKITIDKSGANTAAVHSLIDAVGQPVELRQIEVFERPCRARSPRHQTANSADARIPGLSFSRQDNCRYRNHAHDPQGAARLSQGHHFIFSAAILLPSILRTTRRLGFSQPSPLIAT